MAKRRTIFLVSYIVAVAVLALGIYLVLRSRSGAGTWPLLPFLYSLLGPLFISGGSLAFRPVRAWVEDWLKQDVDGAPCRVYLFGHGGSGKTALIESLLLSGKNPTTHKSTPDFDLYTNTLAVERGVYLQVELADYKGQKPSMVTIDLPDNFAGPRDNRFVNAIFFLVDFVRRVAEDERVLEDNELLEWLRSDTMRKIQERVAQHHKYLNEFTLEPVFTTVYSSNLRSVRLLINKMDLLEQAVLRGYLPELTYESIEGFARSAFADVERQIKAACDENGIADFSVHLISANKDGRVRPMAAGVWKTHLHANGVTVL